MRRLIQRACSETDGGVLVETTVMMTILFVFILGSVDFLMAMYQWNAATKAVEIGARIAAVSDPVSSDVSSITGLGSGLNPGDPMPAFTRTCNGATSTCTGGTFSQAALNTIVYGRGSAACGDSTSVYTTGMCDIFSRILPANVVITYTQSGLGYVARPGGPVPTITVSVQNLPFQFYFLGGFMGMANTQIPGLTTSITGEDLSSSAPP
ncbi:TadE/TadG family type IV pilus assembly protein [Bradyrhizobium erythrophlei]|uniref:TadE/TadG family type IV pilus assembly protein n=1 Tax=Bradyrhizobium erythrophlei TaxID=1437360 RepID=UPI0035EC4D22